MVLVDVQIVVEVATDFTRGFQLADDLDVIGIDELLGKGVQLDFLRDVKLGLGFLLFVMDLDLAVEEFIRPAVQQVGDHEEEGDDHRPGEEVIDQDLDITVVAVGPQRIEQFQPFLEGLDRADGPVGLDDASAEEVLVEFAEEHAEIEAYKHGDDGHAEDESTDGGVVVMRRHQDRERPEEKTVLW